MAIGLRADKNVRGSGLELDATDPDVDGLTTEEVHEQHDFWFSPALTVAAPVVMGRQSEEVTNTGTVLGADLDEMVLTASVGTITITDNGDGIGAWIHTVTEAVGSHEVTITADDHDEGSTSETFVVVVEDRPARPGGHGRARSRPCSRAT